MTQILLTAPTTKLQSEILLRPEQKEMVGSTYRLLRNGARRVLLVAVMGLGKTLIAAWMMRDAVSRGRRCVFVVTLNVLISQTVDTLSSLGVNCTILQGDRPVDRDAAVIVASLQTISIRLRRGNTLDNLLGPIGVVMVDEAHVAVFHNAYQSIEDRYLPTGTIFLGLTATPWRLSTKEYLGQKFDELVVGPQPPDAICLGAALPCRGFTLTGALDLDTLHIRNGEYIDSEIASQACRPEALKHVFSEWKRLCFGRPTLHVGATIEQALLTRDHFLSHGVAAETIIGSTPAGMRQAIFERVKQGKTQIITSVGCLSFGFNLPSISAVVYVRATRSKALFHQTGGRGSRPSPGKIDFLLLDFGGNLKRHGSPMEFQNYNIGPLKQEDAPPLTKTCPGCGAEVNVFAQICSLCGYDFSGDVDETEDEEEKLILHQLNEFVDSFTRIKIQNLRSWKKQDYLRDRTPDEAIERFANEYGHIPPPQWTYHACLTRRYSPKRQAEFIAYLERHWRRDKRWAQQWRKHHLRLEFGTANVDIEPQWWQILEVDRAASWEQVKQAYAQKADQLFYQGENCKEQIQWFNLALSDAREEMGLLP